MLFCLIGLSCSSNKTTLQPSITRVWMLTEFKSFTKSYLIEKKASLNLSAKDASASMGCNMMSFPFKILDNSTIKFSSGIATQMHCEDMTLEREFSETIIEITSYKLQGQQLILSNKNGDKMVFIAQDWD